MPISIIPLIFYSRTVCPIFINVRFWNTLWFVALVKFWWFDKTFPYLSNVYAQSDNHWFNIKWYIKEVWVKSKLTLCVCVWCSERAIISSYVDTNIASQPKTKWLLQPLLSFIGDLKSAAPGVLQPELLILLNVTAMLWICFFFSAHIAIGKDMSQVESLLRALRWVNMRMLNRILKNVRQRRNFLF